MAQGKSMFQKVVERLPWWSSGKESPYNAGDAGSIPGQGTKIPHAVGQLSPRTTTTELMRLN